MPRRPGSLVLALLLLTAFVLRAWRPSHMAIEHFDEGVYASNFFSDHLGFRYPDQHLYAPPFLPALLEWILIFSSANPHSVMWANVILGTALVAAVWWTTRELAQEWLEPVDAALRSKKKGKRPPDLPQKPDPEFEVIATSSALTAATLIAFNGQFIAYSRAALTDIPLCLWLTLAVGAGARAFRTGAPIWIVGSGALTALAWWTKYNGWLPLAILGAGAFGWGAVIRPRKPAIPKTLGMWVGICVVAILLWSPFLWSLQKWGGYAAVAENHAGYVLGWKHWFPSLWRHVTVDSFYGIPSTSLGIMLACLIGFVSFTWNQNAQESGAADLSRRRLFCVTKGLILGAAVPFFAGGSGMVGFLILGGLLGIILIESRPAAERIPWTQWIRSPGAWVIAAWIFGLLLATPLYRPYPRLALPLWIGLAIGGSIILAHYVSQALNKVALAGAAPLAGESERKSWSLRGFVVGFACLLLLTGGMWSLRDSFIPWEDRRGLLRAAEEVVQALKEDAPKAAGVDDLNCVVYVLAEPGLYYHLASQEDGDFPFITQPASDLGMLKPGAIDARVPAYLVTGMHARDVTDRLNVEPFPITLVKEWRIPASDLVLLDELKPGELKNQRLWSRTIRLWAIHQP